MESEQGIKTLKIKVGKKFILHSANWITGADKENPQNQNETEDEEYKYEEQDYQCRSTCNQM